MIKQTGEGIRNIEEKQKGRTSFSTKVPVVVGIITLLTLAGAKTANTNANAERKTKSGAIVQVQEIKSAENLEKIRDVRETLPAKVAGVQDQNKKEKEDELKDKVLTFCTKMLKVLENAAIWSLCVGGVTSLAVGIIGVATGWAVGIMVGVGAGGIAGAIAGFFVGAVDGFMNAGHWGMIAGAIGGSFVGKFVGFAGSICGGVISAVVGLCYKIVRTIFRHE